MAKLHLISCLFVALTALLFGLVEAGAPRSTYVKHPASIQQAIKRAKPGDTIVVGKGTYKEHLTINKDGIKLIGKGAILVPPTKPTYEEPNDCVGLAGNKTVAKTAGICIVGSGVELYEYEKEHRKLKSVKRRVKDVTVEGFDVRGFNGLNIAILGAKNARVAHNTVTDGGEYGILTVGSISTVVTENRVKTTSLLFIGICMDDTSDVRVTKNTVSDYGIGLCIQTKGAKVSQNTVFNCCVGAFVDPGIDGARVTDNRIRDANPICAQLPNTTASGIAVGGGTNAVIKGNKITGISDFGNKETFAAGIAVFDFGAVASGNKVVDNELRKNDQDLLLFSTGKDNTFSKNDCKTPAELCK